LGANRFNRNGLKKVDLPNKSEELAELVGIILGDGDLNRYQLRITLNSIVDKEYLVEVENLLKRLFGDIKVFKIKRRGEGCTVVGVSSVEIVNFLKGMSVASRKPKVPGWIFLKREYGNNILLTFVRDVFNKLGYSSTQSLIKNLYLSNDREIDKYRKLVGFRNQKLERKSLIRNYSDYLVLYNKRQQ